MNRTPPQMASTRRPLVPVGLAVGALLLALLIARPAHAAASHYASPNGTGVTCTQDAPCAVQTAIASAAAGDLVFLFADQGGYEFTGSLSNLPNTPIRLHSFAGRAQLDFSAGQLSLTGGSVDGLSIHGSNQTTAFTLSGGAIGTRMIVQAGNAQPACALNGATLLNSVCTAVAETGSFAMVTDGTNVLRNDTLVGGTTAALSANLNQSTCKCTSATDTVVNVIARSAVNGTDIAVGSDGSGPMTVKARYSNFATNALTGAGAPAMTVLKNDGTDQVAAPVFVAQPPGNTHEDPTSPTIDAGQTSTDNSIYDVDGNPRTMGTTTDIGADEFVGPPDTAISSAAIHPTRFKATFTFSSIGPATGFECQLVLRTGTVVPTFKACTSPKTYRHLGKGRWRFRVRAVGVGGTDATPARQTFRI